MQKALSELSAKKFGRVFIFIAIGWTLLIAALMIWNYHRMSRETLNQAITEAQTAFAKDVAYRQWVNNHGGVYAPITEQSPPNPYLEDISERDIKTPSGRSLTLINGAYMARQVYELLGNQFGSSTRITSLKPLRPANQPDEWESEALRQIANGKKAVWDFQEINGSKKFRYIEGMKTKKPCLKCHEAQGHREGDIRGGISISIEWSRYHNMFMRHVKADIATFIGIWAVCLAGILMAGNRTKKYMQQLHRAEEEKNEMDRRLLHAQKLESLGVMASGIAHDFNNVLTTIIGNLALAQKKLSVDSPVVNNIINAMKGAKSASELTRQMLAYSGKGYFQIEQIDLNRLVQDNFDILKSSISKSVTFNLKTEPDLSLIEGDSGQIQQIVLNLITNASESIGDGIGTVTVTTGAGYFGVKEIEKSRLNKKPDPGHFVWVMVSDTGCGMDEGVQEKIFDPFFTTKFTGRGLGMSAVLGIIKSHNGAIMVESAPGEGTVMQVLFPALMQHAAAEVIEEQKKDGQEIKKTGSAAGKIMVVDDEDMVRSVCVDIIKYCGFGVFAACNGAEAIEIFKEHSQDISCVILDATMPVMDGAETFEKLRELNPDIKIIVSTGYSTENIRKRFPGFENSMFIQKPFTLEKLRHALQGD
ncbi:MAG: DUF3365 domain-containing protein [Nitrospirae bacterium]|nr:DUF3365 domain-containing protein [Nitrospirota bacterium]